MAVYFDSRKSSQGYKSSLSAIENVWSGIASTKANLDNVDKRIRIATNVCIDDLIGDRKFDETERKSRFTRKYGQKKTGHRVKINPNPRIDYRESDEDFGLSENENHDEERNEENYERYDPYGDKFDTRTASNIKKDFDYNPSNILANDRPITPKIPRLDSSIDRKSLLYNIKDSSAIARIRQQIQQQKENLSSPEMQAPPSKPRHAEEDYVLLNDDRPQEPMKRKVATSSHAPSYKGFSIPDAKEAVAQKGKSLDPHHRKLATHKERKERVGYLYDKEKTNQKANIREKKKVHEKGNFHPKDISKKEAKRSPGKMQRIVAHRKPVPSITVSSWRIGQEAVKKVLGSMKETKMPTSKEEDQSGQGERVSKGSSEMDGTEDEKMEGNIEKDREFTKSDKQSIEKSDQRKTDYSKSDRMSEESCQTKTSEKSGDGIMNKASDTEDEDLETLSKDLHKNEDLPEEAKSMLGELQLDTSDTEEKDLPSNVPKAPPQKRGATAKASPSIKKRGKRKASQSRQKHEEGKASKAKIRHYDQEEIQNYMAKQMAERKKKQLQEKKKQQQLKFEQEKKLTELYLKQKSGLRASIGSRQLKIIGSTFTKPNRSEGNSQANQDKNRLETAVKQTREGDDIDLLGAINQHRISDENGFPSSPPIGESSKRENLDQEDLDETIENEIEDEFKDSLEFDKFEVPGIKNITVRKAGSNSPVHPKELSAGEPKDVRIVVRSVENEVRELLEKYKASRPNLPRANENRKPGKGPPSDLVDPSKLSKAERIAAISATASSLRERLAAEADRLASLRLLASKGNPPASSTMPYTSIEHSTEFRGALPGTGNLHDQAKISDELTKQEKAATKIQAVFRGHCTRQELNWKSPSVEALQESLRMVRRKSPDVDGKKAEAKHDEQPARDSYSYMFDVESDVELFSEKTSTESLINEARTTSQRKEKGVSRPKFKSLQDHRAKRRPQHDDPLREIFELKPEKKGDRYSVINILARRLKNANKHEYDKEESRDEENDTRADLYEQDFEDDEFDSLSSKMESDRLSRGEEDKTISTEEESEMIISSKRDRSSLHPKEKYTEDYEEEEEEDGDKTMTLLPEDLPVDGDDPSVKIRSYRSDGEHSISSSRDVISPTRSPASLTEGSVDYEKEPVMSSTMRNAAVGHEDRRKYNELDSSLTSTNSITGKFSPGTLERKLRAEVNQLETMDDALRQVTDIERVRGVTLAQQETVSLAQILKARQLGYKQELDKLSKDATEQAKRNIHEMEQVKESAAQASDSVARRLAEIRADAAGVVAESTRRLEEVQNEAAKRAEEAAKKVEKAQKVATDVAIESTNRYSTDVATMATAAASSAASSAVQAAMQVHREQLEKLRAEALKKVSRSYSNTTYSSSSSRSESADSKTPTDSMSVKEGSKISGASYYDNDFEEQTPQNSSQTESSARDSTISIHEISRKSSDDRANVSKVSANGSIRRSEAESMDESIEEDVESSRIEDANVSRQKSIETEVDESSPARKTSEIDPNTEEVEMQNFKIDDHMTSSLTEDDIDDGFRMVLPVVSHRRKSLEKERRSRRGRSLSDNGTSSDDMKRTPKSTAKHGTHSPFAGEDTFNQFTSEIVRQYIQEEETRGKHQRALLKIREKALLEKAKAEMAWLEMQKSTLRNKGADDLMPPLNKKQRGLWLKLQSEQNEIRRLKQAYRAASHERRFMMYQQNEIVRLKEETQKIWSKLGHDKAAKSHEEKLGESHESVQKTITEASSIASIDEATAASHKLSINSLSASTPLKTLKLTAPQSQSQSNDSRSFDSTAEVPEDIPETQQQSSETKDDSFPTYSGAEKTIKSSTESQNESSKLEDREEGESTADDVSVTEHTQSSMIADLKRLKKKASEQYLMKRENVLKDRRNKFESVLKSQLEMTDWQKRIEMEEVRLKLDIKKALDGSKVKARPSNVEKSSHEDASESSESTIKSQANSAASRTSSTKSIFSKGKSSESEASVMEEIKTASNETDRVVSEESILSGNSRKVSRMSTPDQYAEDTFDSPSASKSKSRSTSNFTDNAITASPKTPSRKRYSKDSDESRSEEDVSLADATSDASDVEKRIRQLEEELLKRRKDLDRIRKRREKDQLRKQEQRLKQELQAVENLIQQEDKENLNNDRSINDSNSLFKAPVSPKIMSPKVLQPTNQHDHLGKKQSKESKAKTDLKEAAKRDRDRSNDSLERRKRDAGVAREIANIVAEQVKEKTAKERRDNDDNIGVRSLSEEVEALKELSQRYTEGSMSKQSASERDGEKRRKYDEEDTSFSSKSAKEQVISKSLSKEISSSKSESSKVSVSGRARVYSRFEGTESDKSKPSQMSETRSPSGKSVVEECSKVPESPREDDSISEGHIPEDQSDSLRSISESIFSDRSVEEELKTGSSNDQSNVVGSESRKDEGNYDICNDDFFETPSSKSLQSENGKSVYSKRIEDDIQSATIRDDVSPVKTSSERSSKSISLRSKMTDASAEEKISKTLSSYEGFLVNDRVIVDGLLKGTIRFIGRVSFSPVAVAGIELDEKVGNSDGTFRSKRYFTCNPDRGLFSPIANIAHLERKESSERKGELVSGKSNDTISEIAEESIKTDILEDVSERSVSMSSRSNRQQENSKQISTSEAKSESRSDLKHKSSSSTTVPANQKERASSKVSKEYSYNDDFEEDEKSATEKEISYLDDFEEISAKDEQKAALEKDRSQHERSQESTNSSVSEQLSIHTEAEDEESYEKEKSDGKEKTYGKDKSYSEEEPGRHFNELRLSPKGELPIASPSTLSDVESSDAEIVPHPPRVDLVQLADSLTEGLLKRLLSESVEMTNALIRRKKEERVNDTSGSQALPKSDNSSVRKAISDANGDKKEDSTNETSEEINESVSEKSGDTIKRMSGHNSSEDLDLEVSEAFIVPAGNDVLEPNKAQIVMPDTKDEMRSLERLRDDQNRRPGLVEELLKRDEEKIKLSPSASTVSDKEIAVISKDLIQEAISQMMQIMKTKKAKLAKDEEDELVRSNDRESRIRDEEKNVTTSHEPIEPGPLGHLPKLASSPPKSPTDFDLEKPRSAIDTDLLAAKLSELKRMDQEIDVLLGEDSDEEEPFAPINRRSLNDDETDMTPVRIFDFGEPLIYVPNTQKDVKKIVAESAKILISRVAAGEDYGNVTPDEAFLRKDVNKVDGEMEKSSQILFTRMIFDVTRDLLKEIEEFREFQTSVKSPWSVPNRRIFPKFIRQIHNLTGDELVESFQDHICVCLGLKQGRPSLGVLKKRLPLNTSKKDYIDALLVEELREEEPRWINYEEDEIRVKEQLTDGILEGLISETTSLFNDIQLKRAR